MMIDWYVCIGTYLVAGTILAILLIPLYPIIDRLLTKEKDTDAVA